MEPTAHTGKLVILSAPSGSGKTSIMKQLLERFPVLEFSISATSRAPRTTERDEVDYHFLSGDEFRRRIQAGDFIEWEEVYAGTYYGTLRSELERIWARGHAVVFDVDVMGGINLKRIFGQQALSVFIMPPSVEELRKRLVIRGTESPEAIERRVDKAETEIARSGEFDRIVVNDDLSKAVDQVSAALKAFL